jgi:hypothetical protein
MAMDADVAARDRSCGTGAASPSGIRFQVSTGLFAICDFWVLADRSRTAADCCNQLLNDAMFNVRGQFRRQDFSRPTGATKRIAFNGYEIVQYPMMV